MNLPVLPTQSTATLAAAPYLLRYLIPAAMAAELARYSGQWRQLRVAGPFSLLMAAVALSSISQAMSVAGSTLPAALFWAKIQYGGIVLIGPIFLLFVLAYDDTSVQVPRAQRVAPLMPAALGYAAVLTNDWHHLWWPTVALDVSRPFGSLHITRGRLFWLHFAYNYGCVLLGGARFVRMLFTAPAPQRRQARLLAAGALALIAGSLAHVLGVRTTAVDDPTPLLFTATGLLIFYAASRTRFLALMRIALPEVLAQMPDGLVLLDHRGVVMACNDAAPYLLATPRRDWNGRKFLDVIAGSPLEIDLRALLAPPVRAATRQITYARADSVRAIELRLRPFYAGHADAGVLLVVRDRTDRAQLEQAREQQVHELSVLRELAHAANIARGTDELLPAITRALMRVLPSTRVVIGLLQPNGTTLRLVVDEAMRTESTLEGQAVIEYDAARLQHILHTGQPRVISVADPQLERTPAQAILHNAGVRTVLVVPLASPAAPLGAMFVGHGDQRKLAPNEVRLFASVGELVSEAIDHTRHIEEVQEASRAKSMLLATVSHEFRTPLTSIIGFIDMLEQGVFGELPEWVHEPLARVRQSGFALLRLTNDLLDFSKMDAGHLAIDLEPVDLATVIQNVLGALQPQIRERGLALTVAIAPNLPRVHGNSARLAQVLTNLLANAIKFTERGSITVRAMDHGERVRFSVADTGIGIAPEQQGILFQEFQQIKNEHMRRYSGTGLGLAISQRLMQLMGGTLTVESTPGVGSTFYGEVPIVPKSLREKEQGGGSR
jgi:signal transduction histidine kinase/PAS domain-containing protein/uncharacterized membrane protein